MLVSDTGCCAQKTMKHRKKQGAPLNRMHPAKSYRQQRYVQQGVPRRERSVFLCWGMMSLFRLPSGKLSLPFLAVPAGKDGRVECPCQTVDICEKVFYADVPTLADTFAGNHQMPRNVKVNSTGLVTSGIYSGWTLAPQLSSPPTPICSPIARMTV